MEKVNFGKKTAKRILRVAHIFEVLSALAIAILLIAATILIGNTIRLSIFARRREIEVMKLVGASNWFVRGPFMVEGLLTGLIGAAAAVVLLFLGKELILPTTIGRLDAGKDVNAIAFEYTALLVLLLGLVLGAAGSSITMRRFLQRLIVELTKRGKLIMGEPYFVPGHARRRRPQRARRCGPGRSRLGDHWSGASPRRARDRPGEADRERARGAPRRKRGSARASSRTTCPSRRSRAAPISAT